MNHYDNLTPDFYEDNNYFVTGSVSTEEQHPKKYPDKHFSKSLKYDNLFVCSDGEFDTLDGALYITEKE